MVVGSRLSVAVFFGINLLLKFIKSLLNFLKNSTLLVIFLQVECKSDGLIINWFLIKQKCTKKIAKHNCVKQQLIKIVQMLKVSVALSRFFYYSKPVIELYLFYIFTYNVKTILLCKKREGVNLSIKKLEFLF